MSASTAPLSYGWSRRHVSAPARNADPAPVTGPTRAWVSWVAFLIASTVAGLRLPHVLDSTRGAVVAEAGEGLDTAFVDLALGVAGLVSVVALVVVFALYFSTARLMERYTIPQAHRWGIGLHTLSLSTTLLAVHGSALLMGELPELWWRMAIVVAALALSALVLRVRRDHVPTTRLAVGLASAAGLTALSVAF
ncbi:MAG: hypothetical protein Q4G34_01710 [Micrococcus sp.]|nr:hypothetical protein [Micrococcus sp.]